MSHAAHLAHKAAHAIRQTVLEKHNYQCKCCGKKEGEGGERLQLHHVKPVSLGGWSDKDNLIPLCQACHTRVHKEWARNIPLPEDIIHG